MGKKQVYTFLRSTDGKTEPERIEKTEEELTDDDNTFLFNQLLWYWNSSPPKVQRKFIDRLMDVMEEKRKEKVSKLMEKEINSHNLNESDGKQ